MGEDVDCLFHEGVRGTRLCNTCGARVCDDCAITERHKDADSGKTYHSTRCPICELDCEIAKLGTPLSSLGTAAVILLTIPLLAFAVNELAYDLLSINAADPGLFGYATVALVFLALVTLPLFGLRHEIRKIRQRPYKLKSLNEEKEALMAKSRLRD